MYMVRIMLRDRRYWQIVLGTMGQHTGGNQQTRVRGSKHGKLR
jgi:hypothetical protein